MTRPEKYVIITYDISEDKKRKKLSDKLKYWGLKRFQYSVFMGHLKKKEAEELTASLKDFQISDGDKIFIFTLCKRCYEQKTMIGSTPSPDEKEHVVL